MIKKLKIKFIFTNMALISLVLFVSFAVMYYNSAKQLKENSLNAMKDIAFAEGPNANGLFDKEHNNKHPNYSTYILDIDSITNTCFIDGFGDADELTEENVAYLNELIGYVRNSQKNEGVIEKFNLRFFVADKHYGTRIVLLDKQFEDNTLKEQLFSYLITGALAFLAFLGISILIASIAVKPIEKSINQQKQLVSDMSHELKTPITIVSTNTDIILSHADSTVEEEKKWLGYIKDETARMAELINMMLYLAKNDEFNKPKLLSDIDLSNAVMESALPFESICFEKEKEFRFDIESNVHIKGDAASIKQLLAILLDNAVKYSNEHGRIELSLAKQGDKAILTVFNTGEPIPKEHIPFIFERFYRVDKARSRESGGSGLGLSIAKSIIETNEADISVLSNYENGTVFTCTFKMIKHKKQ